MDIYLVFGFISEDGSDEGHTYIYGVFDDTISGELTSQRGSRIRFQNLKQNGHI